MRNHFHPLDSSARANRWRKVHGSEDVRAIERRNGFAVVSAGQAESFAAKCPDRMSRSAIRLINDKES